MAVVSMVLAPSAGQAAGSASLSLSPASGSYALGSNLVVTVYEDSTDAINAVEADLTYDSSKLQYVSVDMSGSAFDLIVPHSNGGGSVKLSAAKSGGATYTGSQVVGAITFKVLGGSGTTAINFDGKDGNGNNSSSIVRPSDSTNVWNGVITGGSYGLTGGSTGGTGGGSTGGTTSTGSTSGGSSSSKTTTGTSTPATGTTSSPTSSSPSTTTPTTSSTYGVAFKVLDASGKPVMGAVVTINSDSATTDSTGIASFPNLSPGQYNVKVTNKNQTKTQKITVAATGKPLAVQQFQLQLAATGLANKSRLVSYGLILLLIVVVIGSGFGLSHVLAGHHHEAVLGVNSTPEAPTASSEPVATIVEPTAAPPTTPVPPAGTSNSAQIFYPEPGSTPVKPPEEGPPDA